MTGPTRSMARMAHSPPSPPPSAARLGQESTIGSALLSPLGVVIFSTIGVEGPRVCCGLTGVDGGVMSPGSCNIYRTC